MPENAETVLITGASSGIGESLARVFASHGHDLILVARNEGKLEQLADELAEEHGVMVSVRPTDLSTQGSAHGLAKALHREGQVVDILVNNAGVLSHGAFAEMPAEDHRRMVQLNVAGLTDMLSHFIPDMVARGSGRVLNVASIGAFQPIPSLATYAATKAYVLSLSEALGEELRSSGVTVTALCPGITETHMVTDAPELVDSLRHVRSFVMGDAETVAAEGFKGCMKGTPIVVPGTINLSATLAARAMPKWLVRRLSGLMGRSTL